MRKWWKKDKVLISEEVKVLIDNDKISIESKNIKRFYVPRIMVIYFTDSDLTMLGNFSKNVVEYVEFVKIGSRDVEKQGKIANPFNKKFFSWKEMNKNVEKIMKPSAFFNSPSSKELIDRIKDIDIAIIVYKSNDINALKYSETLSNLLDENDVFSFHFVVENFVQTQDSRKIYDKLVRELKRKRQLYIPIKEESIVEAFKNANISNRSYYANLYFNNLIDLFISPFLDPIRNPDAFSKIKALFYQSKKNFETEVVSSIGYSNSSVACLDLALIQALSNPMFAAAFEASNTFIVSVKMPYFLDSHFARIREVLRSVVGEWKKFYILTHKGPYEFDKYCHVSIMAINVDSIKLIKDGDEIQKCVKKILNNVQKSKNLFDNEKTREILMDHKKIDLL